MRRDGTLNDYATFAFTGTAVTYYASEDTNRGYAAVSLDGGAETLVDLYAATQRGNVAVYTRTGLSAGTHTLKVRVSGQKDTASSNIVAAIDRVDVRTGTGATVGSDLSLRATSGGLDARVVVHSPSETGPFTLTLAPDPRTQLVQDPSGAITVTQVVTDYGDDGVTPYVVTQTEYMIQPALATATSSDPAAPVDVGAAAMRLGTSASSAPTLALTVDPAWLSRHPQSYPIAAARRCGDAGGHTRAAATV